MGRSPSDLLWFIGSRLLQLVPVVLGIIVIMFLLTHVFIADPCAAWYPHARPNVLQACVTNFGLNLPLYDQLGKYLTGLAGGDWGVDPQNGAPVLPTILIDLPATIELVLAALFLMIIIGIPLGVIAAARAGRAPDHAVRVFYLLGWATPTYLVAVLLVVWAGPALGLPSNGAFTTNPPFPEYTHMSLIDAAIALNPYYFGDAFAHILLPALALAFLNLGIITRMTRSSMLEVLPADYIKTARMKGISERRVLYRHALRNSLISTVTVLGFTASGLLAGTVVIEYVFNWPGIGRYTYDAFSTYNFAGAIGIGIVFAIAVVIANLIADVLYGVLDPRVEWR